MQDIQVVEDWYKEAQNRDPRPEVKARAKEGIRVLEAFKTAATAASAR